MKLSSGFIGNIWIDISLPPIGYLEELPASWFIALVIAASRFVGLYSIYIYTLWLFNIAMENGPFIDGLPIKKKGDLPWLC